MNCDKVKELLWAYLENKTTAEETAEIETHLEGCAACREELAQQKEIKNALASLPDEELPEDYHTELMQKLQAERKVVPFPAKKKHGWKQMSMIAAAVLVVVVAGGTRGMLEMRQNQNEEIEQILFEDTALMADTGEETAEQTAADSATENNAAEKSDTKEDFSEQELTEVLKQCGLVDWVQSLPNGLDEVLGEKYSCSGGEAQRIGLARALLRHPKMLILDEITSALDNKTALQVEQNLLSQQNMMIVMVTHKLNEKIMQQYDEILLMQNGSLQESGTFEQLMEQRKAFYELYQTASPAQK
mgnify:CR=1 FL=1